MLKTFIDNYDTVIFDMDGVITSEQNYWNAAALTVWEYIRGGRLSGECREIGEPDTAAVRREVFSDGRLITILKNKGVNSNWDLGYVTLALAVIHGTEDFSELPAIAEKLSDNILDEYEPIAAALSQKLGGDCSRSSSLWRGMHECFQEWYLGDELYEREYGQPPKRAGKRGLIYTEEPLLPIGAVSEMLTELNARGIRVCIGTGRPSAEIDTPLSRWGIFDLFAPDGIITYDYVERAEAETGLTLTKPHPYMFLKALYGADTLDADIIAGRYDAARIERTLVVGDAGADILAAHAMGADFAAVLTGINGKGARQYFEDMSAEYILDDVTRLMED